jgi:elongation factor Ts
MGAVSPAMIKELRDKTGLGLKKCKEALVETGGDVEKAVESLRKAGMASAEKRMDRTTSQGSVFPYISEDGKKGALVALSCETDFVAKTDDFKALGLKLAKHCAENSLSGAEALAEASIDGVSVGDMIKEHIAKLGENLNAGKVSSFSASGKLFDYVHGEGALLGVMLEIDGADDGATEIGKDLCMHIAASAPVYTNKDEVPAEILEKEKDIYREQITGKPENVIEKILTGKMNKFYQENCLEDQTFIKDDKKSVAKILSEANSSYKIKTFARFQIGA